MEQGEVVGRHGTPRHKTNVSSKSRTASPPLPSLPHAPPRLPLPPIQAPRHSLDLLPRINPIIIIRPTAVTPTSTPSPPPLTFSPTPSALFYGMLPSSVRPSPGPPPPPPTAPRCYLEAPLSLSPVRRLGVAVLTDPPASPQPHRRVPSSISAAGGRPINCDGDRITGTAGR